MKRALLLAAAGLSLACSRGSGASIGADPDGPRPPGAASARRDDPRALVLDVAQRYR